MSGPSFVGIGPRRTGSSWVWTVLRRGSRVWLPPIKELRYWDEMQGRGRLPAEWRRQVQRRTRRNLAAAREIVGRKPDRRALELGFDLRYLAGPPSDGWYRRLFAGAAPGLPTGEISPSYFHLAPPAIDAFDRALPDVRIFLTLRDPLDRVWSATVKAVPGGLEGLDRLDRQEIVDLARARLHSYGRGLEQWTAVVPPERMCVLWFDDLATRPDRYFAELLAFLGVDDEPHRLLDGVGGAINASVGGRRPVPAWFRERFTPRILVDLDRVEAVLGHQEHVARWRAGLMSGDR